MLMGNMVPFHWEFTHQRAFEEVKRIVGESHDHYHIPLKYGPGMDPIFMVTDGCATGISGLVSQGRPRKEWKNATVAAFYSTKLNSAQQNYAVHEIEMFAGVEMMLRHQDILQGTHFKWITDHKRLIHLMNQKNLMGRQAHWMDKIREFDIPGTMHSEAEYTKHDNSHVYLSIYNVSIPVLTGTEAVAEKCHRPQKIPPPSAETGHPETRAKFAQHVKDHLILLGPGVPKEGGVEDQQTTSTKTHLKSMLDAHMSNSENIADYKNIVDPGQQSQIDTPKLQIPNTSLIDIVSEGCDSIDLLDAIKNKYLEDLFFKNIIEHPKKFKNFEVTKGG